MVHVQSFWGFFPHRCHSSIRSIIYRVHLCRSSAQACGVELLDGERQTWDRQERERRGMFAQEEVNKRESYVQCPTEVVQQGPRACCPPVVGIPSRKNTSNFSRLASFAPAVRTAESAVCLLCLRTTKRSGKPLRSGREEAPASQCRTVFRCGFRCTNCLDTLKQPSVLCTIKQPARHNAGMTRPFDERQRLLPEKPRRPVTELSARWWTQWSVDASRWQGCSGSKRQTSGTCR